MPNLIERIEAFNKGRDETQVRRKYHLMRDSAFVFMRGTCHLFFEDWPKHSTLNKSPAVWIAGDLHLENFAIYQGHDSQIYLDINDFDDGLLAPCVWDVARFLTNLHVAYEDRAASVRKQLTQRYLAAYSAALETGHMRSVQPATAPPDVRNWMTERSKRKREKLLNKFSVRDKKKRKFKSITDETYALKPTEKQHAINLLNRWSKSRPDAKRFRVIDVCGRLSGISSIGLERYLMLVEGDGSPDDNLLLEIKQRTDSALMPYVTIKQPDWLNAAARVVALQQRLQAVPPAPLDVITNDATCYTIREQQPVQEKIPLEQFKELSALQSLVETLGSLTAWAHLRGCGRQSAAPADDLIALAAQSAWQTDILQYASDYAAQIKSDYKTFCKSPLGKEK